MHVIRLRSVSSGIGWREARETGRRLMAEQALAKGFHVLQKDAPLRRKEHP